MKALLPLLFALSSPSFAAGAVHHVAGAPAARFIGQVGDVPGLAKRAADGGTYFEVGTTLCGAYRETATCDGDASGRKWTSDRYGIFLSLVADLRAPERGMGHGRLAAANDVTCFLGATPAASYCDWTERW